MNRLLPCVAVVLLASCASVYVPPADTGSLAHVTFVVDADPIMGYGASLWKYDQADDQRCFAKDARMATVFEDVPIGTTDNPERIPIPGGEVVSLRAVLMPASAFNQIGCERDIHFASEAGSHYRVTLTWSPDVCKATVERLHADGKAQPVPDARVELRRCGGKDAGG